MFDYQDDVLMAQDGSYSSSDFDDSEEDALLLTLLEEEAEEAENRRAKRGGSKPGRAPNKQRRRSLYSDLLFEDYWGHNPVYDESDFRRRFRMLKGLFDEILVLVVGYDKYFVQETDAL